MPEDTLPPASAPSPVVTRPVRPVLSRSGTDPRQRIIGLERGMIFWATVAPREAVGSEQNHTFPNPWLIVSRKSLHRTPVAVAVPLSTKVDKNLSDDFRKHRIRILEASIERYAVPASEELQAGDSLALTEQVRVMAHARLNGNPVAMATIRALIAVEAGLKFVMELG